MEAINAFLRRCQLWKACASDDDRPVLEYIYFENNYAYASDSHILVRVPLDQITNLDEEDIVLLNGHGIHAPLFKALINYWPLKIEKRVQEALETVHICCFSGDNGIDITLTNPEQQKHPNFEPLFQRNGERIPITRIGVDQKRLGNLTAAIGTSDIKMEFMKADKKIFVTPINEVFAGAEGVIMPILLTGTLEGFE